MRWLALDANPVHIAEQLGHSVDPSKTHDKALVTPADAERFRGLIPKRGPDEREKVTDRNGAWPRPARRR